MKYPQLVSMPSAVSDWLEEQLEARGIDAVVYTRYVLSLLYRDPADVIIGAHKRAWAHDADQLKRSAAVECLKSAADQKCGIESLVDELCAKLAAIAGVSADADGEVALVVAQAPKEKDPARRYYAAFPALAPHTQPKAKVRRAKQQQPRHQPKLPKAPPQHVADEDEAMMYDDLPVDIRELLESPASPRADHEPAAAARAAPTFLQCGTNIISSIWSAGDGQADVRDFALSSTRIDRSLWPADDAEDFAAAPAPWSEGGCDALGESLATLRHSAASCFAVVPPRRRLYELPLAQAAPPTVVQRVDTPQNEDEADAKDKEDLLHSARTHFRPISDKPEKLAACYRDGTTFAIPSGIDAVRYRPADDDSGALYIEGDDTRRYFEYAPSSASDFTLKFVANANDKACQTDMQLDLDLDLDLDLEDVGAEPVGESASLDSDGDEAYQPCPCEQRADSLLADLFGKCEKCAAASWSGARAIGAEWKDGDVWRGEICMSCLGAAAGDERRARALREDVQEDGERLLSDLRSLQQCYELPAGEECYDLNALLGDAGGGNKQRAPMHSASFSFATRLQQDCLMQLATIPTLRSVTL